MVRALWWQVVIREYDACGSTSHHHMNQSLRSGGSLDSDLTQGSNPCILVSTRRCQQAPDGNASLSALQLPQNLIVLSLDLLGSRCPLYGSSSYGRRLSQYSIPSENILHIRSLRIINIQGLNLLNIRDQDERRLNTIMCESQRLNSGHLY